MVEPRRVVVCDDDPERAAKWIGSMDSFVGPDEFIFNAVCAGDLVDEIKVLNERRSAARRGAGDVAVSQDCAFDHADILIVDYDLTPDSFALAEQPEILSRLRGRTGEMVAYLARCFSSVKYVVVVNQGVRDLSFDLTLQRFSESKADLNVSAYSIQSRALWTGEPEGPADLNPWSWPVLQSAPDTWERRCAAVSDLTSSVLDTLGIDEAALTSKQLDPLTQSLAAPKQIRLITFEDIASSEMGLDAKDHEFISDDEVKLRIAISVASRWVDNFVVPAQNVLVDLPHLVSRFPVFGPDDSNEIDSWNRFARKGSSLAPESLEGAAFSADSFCASLWRLDEVRRLAVALPRPEIVEEFVFCEDTSRFVPVDSATEVETDVPGPSSRRFVEQIEGVRYYPVSRLYG